MQQVAEVEEAGQHHICQHHRCNSDVELDHLQLWDEAVIGTICCQKVQLLLPVIALVGGIHIAGRSC